MTVAGLRFADRYRELIADQSDYIEQLKNEKEEVQKNYLDTLNKLEKTDQALENIKKTIERYESENKALRELVALWV
jgi:predicted nuclease with TOPRIM domain